MGTGKRAARPALAGPLVGLALATLAACGGPAATTGPADPSIARVTVDGHEVAVPGPLRLGVFVGGTGNAYASTLIEAFKTEIARIPGAEVTVFDGKYDPTTQINQLTNAVQSGRFNAFSLGAADPRLACDIATEQAPRAGILVVAELLPLCDRATASGEDLRAPGTLSFVGGPYLYEYFVDYLERIVADNPGPQRVVVLNGPALNPINVNLTKAVATITERHPDVRIVADVQTDFTSRTGNEKTTSLLRAHPDTTIVFSPISDLSKGATAALDAAGLAGRTKVYDISGDRWAFDAVRSGAIAATALESPTSAARTIVGAIVLARDGKTYQSVYLNDGDPLPPGAPPSGLTVVTKENIDDFEPQY